MSAIFSFPILKNGKGRLFLLRVSNSKVLNAERIIEFHCESGVGWTWVGDGLHLYVSCIFSSKKYVEFTLFVVSHKHLLSIVMLSSLIALHAQLNQNPWCTYLRKDQPCMIFLKSQFGTLKAWPPGK